MTHWSLDMIIGIPVSNPDFMPPIAFNIEPKPAFKQTKIN